MRWSENRVELKRVGCRKVLSGFRLRDDVRRVDFGEEGRHSNRRVSPVDRFH